MKTRRWVLWTMLIVFLLSALPALSATLLYEKHNIRGKRGYWTVYRSDWSRLWKSYLKFTVGTGVSSITFQTGYHGSGYGDCDMYVGKGFLPTTRSYTRRSAGSSHREKITISYPSAGTYYLRLAGYRKYKTCFRIYYSKTTGGGGGGGTTGWQQTMLSQLNYYRGISGAPNIGINSTLQGVAQRYATRMCNQNFYSHQDPYSGSEGYNEVDRMRSGGYYPTAWAENIAAGQTTVSEVMNSWWTSTKGHKETMINPIYTEVGFGYNYSAAISYRTRWVQNFGRR